MIPAIRSCLALIMAAAPAQPPHRAVSANRVVTLRPEGRIVKEFDFNEQPLGNFESMPVNWRPIWTTGYPRFLCPRFDFSMGHDAPPSVLLSLSGGGSVGASYLSKEVPVHPRCDYEITAWILPQRLVHAAAYVTAYYLDHALNPIPESEKASELVRSPNDDASWTQVRIRLPGGFKQARWIGLSCRVEQGPGTSHSDSPRAIRYHDAAGAAWLDDIRILRLPRATLQMKKAGPVVFSDQPIELSAGVFDSDGVGIDASLKIFDAAGRVVAERALPIRSIEAEAASISFNSLGPGLYVAELLVAENDREILRHSQSFVCLHPPQSMLSRLGFGLILDTESVRRRTLVEPILAVLKPELVKLPLWHRGLDDHAVVFGDPDTVALARTLKDHKIGMVAVLEGAPSNLATQRDDSVYDVLAAPTKTWSPYLGFVLTRFGGEARVWQIGADSVRPTRPQNINPAVENVRSQLQPLFGPAALALPRAINVEPPTSRPATEIESLVAIEHVSAERLQALADPAPASGTARWAAVEPLDEQRYDRRARLADLAKRIVMAMQSGSEKIFIPQPWRFATTECDSQVIPTEDLIIFNTLANTLNGFSPAGAVWLGPGIEAFLFDGGADRSACLVAWQKGTSGGAEPIAINAAPHARITDLWGNSRALNRDQDAGVQMGSLPVVIAPVVADHIRLAAGLRLRENELRISAAPQRRTLSLTNTLSKVISGTLRLAPPIGWRIHPTEFPVQAAPGETLQMEIELRLPRNVAADEYVLTGRLSFGDPTPTGLIIRTPVSVRTPELDVNILAIREGEHLLVTQRVTNRADRRLNLRASLVCPVQATRAQSIRGLGPGETAFRQYRLSNAAQFRGKTLRSCVEQVDGDICHNKLMRCE